MESGPFGIGKTVGFRRNGGGVCSLPVSMDELLAIADAGEIMPPKTTWFEPKLRSGLFIHDLEIDICKAKEILFPFALCKSNDQGNFIGVI